MVHEPGQPRRAHTDNEKALHFINAYTWHVAMYGPASDGSYSSTLPVFAFWLKSNESGWQSWSLDLLAL